MELEATVAARQERNELSPAGASTVAASRYSRSLTGGTGREPPQRSEKCGDTHASTGTQALALICAPDGRSLFFAVVPLPATKPLHVKV